MHDGASAWPALALDGTVDSPALVMELIETDFATISLSHCVRRKQTQNSAWMSDASGLQEEECHEIRSLRPLTVGYCIPQVGAILSAKYATDITASEVRRVTDHGVEPGVVALEDLGEEERKVRGSPDTPRSVSQDE